MTDLLDIPDFLKRVPGDRPDVKPTPTRRAFVRPKNRKPKKKSKPRLAASTKVILYGLHWPDHVINRLSMKECNRIADAGEVCTPAAEVRSREEET
jgi:hypothetical protein